MSVRDARGFAGLATLVSDVTPDIAEAERLGRLRQTAPAPTATSRPAVPVVRAPLGGMSAGTKWVLGIAAVLAVGWLINVLSSHPNAPQVDITPSPSPAVPYTPTPAPPAVRDLAEVKPPVGRSVVLDANQIRYCLAEEIRIKAILPLVVRSARAVNRFNSRVDDYNSRCANYKYRSGTLERVRDEVETRRTLIESLSRFSLKRRSLA